jgi:Multicopper oxidase
MIRSRGFDQGTSSSGAASGPALPAQGQKRQRDDIHPLHLHRHSFELTRVGGKPTAGVIKDVVMLGGYQEAEMDFVADNSGDTLFHCHQQLHMDFGFAELCLKPRMPRLCKAQQDQRMRGRHVKLSHKAVRLDRMSPSARRPRQDVGAVRSRGLLDVASVLPLSIREQTSLDHGLDACS